MGRPLYPGHTRAGDIQGSPSRWIVWGWWSLGSSTSRPRARCPPWREYMVVLSCPHTGSPLTLGRRTSVCTPGPECQHSPALSVPRRHHSLPNISYYRSSLASCTISRDMATGTCPSLSPCVVNQILICCFFCSYQHQHLLHVLSTQLIQFIQLLSW